MLITNYRDMKLGKVHWIISRELWLTIHKISIGDKFNRGGKQMFQCHLGKLAFKDYYVFSEESDAETYRERLKDLKANGEA